MSSRQLALMEGPIAIRVGYWLTPPDLMAQLQEEFDFDYDACPYPRPPGYDGLREAWGSRTWVNPPFGGTPIMAWARKCLKEHSLGKTVVLILPLRLCEHVVAPMCDVGAEIRALPPVAWRNPHGVATKRPSCQLLFVLRGKP